MPVDRCPLCGMNLEYVATTNGGRIPVNYTPGYIVPGPGVDFGYEPRNLNRVEGQMIHPLEARARMQKGDRTIVQVWLPHVPRCPKRQPAPPPEPKRTEPVQKALF